jgi:hypothetical protein
LTIKLHTPENNPKETYGIKCLFLNRKLRRIFVPQGKEAGRLESVVLLGTP